MATIILESYPKLNNSMYSKIGYEHEVYKYYYENMGVIKYLDSESQNISNSKSEYVKLTDQQVNWNPEEHNLIIETKHVINNPGFLFGSNGLASANGSKIGIAVLWMNVESSTRGAVEIGEIHSNDVGPVEFLQKLKFEPKSIKGTLILQVVLYLKNVGIPKENEFHLAKEEGTIFGKLGEDTRIIIDGNGSMFPIMETNKPGEPLWWVECDWSDPTEDKFIQDNFCLYINNAHKDYDMLSLKEGIKNSPLLMEIIASAMQILITEVLSNEAFKSDTINGTNLSPNSISSVVNYYIRNLGSDIDSKKSYELSKLIRMDLINRL